MRLRTQKTPPLIELDRALIELLDRYDRELEQRDTPDALYESVGYKPPVETQPPKETWTEFTHYDN